MVTIDAASLYAATARAAARRAMASGNTLAAARLLGAAAFVHDITRPEDDRALQILLRRQGITMDSPEGEEWGSGWWDAVADHDKRTARFRQMNLIGGIITDYGGALRALGDR